jgi:hypothetical protein
MAFNRHEDWNENRNKQSAETTTKNISYPFSTSNNDAQTRGDG